MEQETRLRTPGREEERGYLRVRAGPDPKAPGSGDWAVAGAQGGAQWVEEGGRKQRQASVDFKPGWEGKGSGGVGDWRDPWKEQLMASHWETQILAAPKVSGNTWQAEGTVWRALLKLS